MSRRLSRPLCNCGCGQRVKGAHNKYATPGCVPRWLRAANCRKGRKTYAYRARAKRFGQVIDRVLQGRKTITREALLEMCQIIHEQSYNTGWHAGRRLAKDERAA